MLRIALVILALGALSACGNMGPAVPRLSNPPMSAAQSKAAQPRTVRVEGADTLFSLSKRYGVSPRAIIDANNLQPPYRLTVGQSLVLPAGWVRAGNTQLMPQLDASLRPVDIGTQRDRWSVGGEAELASRWHTELRYSRETRDGRRLVGTNFVTTASQLAAPVDSVTDQVEGSLRYEAANAAIALSYLGSFYSNRREELSWSNPFTAIAPGAPVAHRFVPSSGSTAMSTSARPSCPCAPRPTFSPM